MAKYAVGQRVSLAFNAAAPDLRVPDQANGKARGTGLYQTAPDLGEVLEVRETQDGVFYLVLVQLSATHNIAGRKQEVKSLRRRVVHEAKLSEV